MTNKQVFEIFTNSFPSIMSEKIKIWFPNGKNSIRVRTIQDKEFIFTYDGSDDWTFETVKSFLKRR